MSVLTEFDKAAPRGERARIERLIAGQEARVRRAFRQFLDAVHSDAVRRQVRVALENQGVDAALRIVDAHVVRLGSVLSQVFITTAGYEVEALARQLGGARAGVAISFDPANPRAAQIMRRNALEFVVEFSRSQAQAAREALTEALQEGLGTVATARAFRDSIGLTAFQRQAVARYRRLLESNDAAALQRDLRDRRFLPEGSPSRAAFLDGEPLGAQRIQRMVERYRQRYLQYRAETIARTETQTVVNQARDEALTQTMSQVGLSNEQVIGTWNTTMDGRERLTHAILNGQQQPKGSPFISESGAKMMYPGDRSLGAPASELLQCRCVRTVQIRF